MKHFYLKHGLSLLLFFCFLSASANEKEVGGLRFDLDIYESTARLLQGSYQGVVTVPSTVTDEGKTFTVTRIADEAFSGCEGLTSVSLPGTLTDIGSDLFSGCRNLKSVTLPEGLTTVTGSMFNGCESLTSIDLPASVTRIEYNAFAGCSGLSSFTLTADMEYIADGAFSGCSGLKTLILADSDRPLSSLPRMDDASLEKVYVGCRIGAEDYWYWESPFSAHQATLSQVEIGPKLKEIQPRLFANCYALTSVTLTTGVKKVGDSAFSGCTGLTELSLGEGIDSIGESAFSGCTGLTTVALPASMACVGPSAFADCTALSSLSLNAVDSIGEQAFAGCRALTAVHVPAVSRMGTGVFAGCTGLTDVTLAEGLTTLPDFTFSDCNALPIIRIPNSVTYIGNNAFMGCKKLTYIDVGKGVKRIGYNAFATWKTIQDVYYRGNVADWCRIYFSTTDIDDEITNPLSNAKEFHVCLSEEEDSVLLTELTIPETVDSVSAHAFSNFRGLTSVTVPAHVKYVGTSAFAFCPYLTTVNIHAQTIQERAFFMCSRLQDVTLGKEVTTLEEEAFGRRVTRLYYEGSLSDWCRMDLGEEALLGSSMFYIEGEPLQKLVIPWDIPEIKPNLFYGHDVITEVLLPPLVHIHPYAFAYCNNLDSVKQDTLSYVEAVAKRQAAPAALAEERSQIDEYAFYNCAKLASVELPGNLTRIGDNAFRYCSALPEITLPEDLTQIGELAFSGCSQLERISIPENLALIGTDAFRDTKWYEQQPDGILYLGKVLYAYKGTLPAHTRLTVKEGTTAICGAAFYECVGLNAITLPEGLTTIGNSAFYGCTGLEQIKLPSSLTQLGYYALAECSSLKAISLPAHLQSIGYGLLTNCSSLTDFILEDSPDTLHYMATGRWNVDFFTENTPLKNVYIGRPFKTHMSFANSYYYQGLGEALETMTFGPNVNNIEWNIWSNNVKKITVYNPEPPILNEGQFYNIDKEACVLYVPEGTTATYAAAEGWKDFFNIQAFDATPVRTPQAAVSGTETHYDVTGKIIDAKKPGLHIIRCSDGTSRKVLIK